MCVWFQVRCPADYFYPILLFFAQLLLLLELFDLTDPLVFCKEAIFLTLRVVTDRNEQLLGGFMVLVGNITGSKYETTAQGF